MTTTNPIVIALVLAVALCGTLSLPAVAQPVTEIAPAPITAKAAVESMGKGFNLGQMFDNQQHPATLETAKPKIDAYYARGFRVVRIPVTWTETIDGVTLADPETGAIDRSQPRLKELEKVVDYALSLPDMYVVINAHHEKGLKEHSRADVLERLWGDITEVFGDRSPRLIFQFLNEPHLANRDAMPPENLRGMTARAYARVRASDPTRLLVIGGNQWFAADEMAKVWPDLKGVGEGQDPYLMATFHHYNPWTFNGDNQGDYADKWTDADISGPMDTMLNWARTSGNDMPVYIGEWGTGWQSRYTEMKCNNIRLYYSKFVSEFAMPKGIPTMVWDDGGWFEVFDHSIMSFENNLVDCIDGQCEWDGFRRFNKSCR